MALVTHSDPHLPHHTLSGSLLGQRYRLYEIVNTGGFGLIYRCHDHFTDCEMVAKVEKRDSSLAKNEVDMLKMLNHVCYKKKGSVQAPIAQFYGSFVTETAMVTVMELLGPTIRDLKKATPFDRFSMSTSLWVCLKLVETMQFMHEAHIVHGDVKPSNFCIGRGQNSRLVYVIDFGVARKFDPNAEYSANLYKESGFIGTARYASLAMQRGQNDGKLGDMWGVYFTTIENLLGQLPWRYEQNKAYMMWFKQQLDDPGIASSLVLHPWFNTPGPPPSVLYFLHCLQKCCYSNQFNHRSIILSVRHDLQMLQFNPDTGSKLDWEDTFRDDHVSQYWVNPIPMA